MILDNNLSQFIEAVLHVEADPTNPVRTLERLVGSFIVSFDEFPVALEVER